MALPFYQPGMFPHTQESPTDEDIQSLRDVAGRYGLEVERKDNTHPVFVIHNRRGTLSQKEFDNAMRDIIKPEHYNAGRGPKTIERPSLSGHRYYMFIDFVKGPASFFKDKELASQEGAQGSSTSPNA
ncbi:MAG: hypothetical protein Q9162_006980 [Coniocarpon cinnabarinum]